MLPNGNSPAMMGAMSRVLDQLRKAVEASDENQCRIARGANIARSQLSRLMRGERGLSIEGIERLAEYLGLEITIRPKRRRKRR